MPSHKKKGVIHEKMLYQDELVYIVDPTGTYDPIQRHIVRPRVINEHVSSKTLEDFEYGLAMKREAEEEREKEEKQHKKAAKSHQNKTQERIPNISALPRKHQRPDFESEEFYDVREEHLDGDADASEATLIPGHKGRKRRKMLEQEILEDVTDEAGSREYVDMTEEDNQQPAQGPSLSADFRLSQRSRQEESNSDAEITTVSNRKKSKVNESMLPQVMGTSETAETDLKYPNKRHEQMQYGLDSRPEADSEDSLAADDLATLNSINSAALSSSPTTPKKKSGIFGTPLRSRSTPGTGRSNRLSLSAEILGPVFEERERRQRQSELQEAASESCHSTRVSRSPSENSVFGKPGPRTKWSARFSSRSRTSSPSTQFLQHTMDTCHNTATPIKPSVTVTSSSPNPFITSSDHHEGNDNVLKDDKGVKKAAKTAKNRAKRARRAAELAARAREVPAPPEKNGDGIWKILSILDDEVRKDRKGIKMHWFLVEWEDDYSSTWEPEGNIGAHIREAYFQAKP